MGWTWSEAHGWIAVQVSAPEPMRAAPGARAYNPNAATGYAPPPGGGVIPIHIVKSCQLVRDGVNKDGARVDPYAEFLSQIPDLTHDQARQRGMNPAQLVPTDQDMAAAGFGGIGNPVAEAYDGRVPAPMRSAPQLVK